MENVQNDIKNTIKELDAAMSVKDMEKVVTIVIQMRYLLRMKKSIKSKISKLGDII